MGFLDRHIGPSGGPSLLDQQDEIADWQRGGGLAAFDVSSGLSGIAVGVVVRQQSAGMHDIGTTFGQNTASLHGAARDELQSDIRLLLGSRGDNRSHEAARRPRSNVVNAQEQAVFTQVPAAGNAVRTNVTAPVKAVLAILRRWTIGDDVGAQILGTDEPGYVADLRSGAASLKTRDMRDRARLLLDIYEGVFALLRNSQAEQVWIKIPRQDLDGQSVLDLMIEGSLRNLIRAQAFVDYVNGR
jgi:hypothetical protein